MTQMDPYERGRRDGVRFAVTWLHRRAREMNDQHAKDILNVAADYLGNDYANKGLDFDTVLRLADLGISLESKK